MTDCGSPLTIDESHLADPFAALRFLVLLTMHHDRDEGLSWLLHADQAFSAAVECLDDYIESDRFLFVVPPSPKHAVSPIFREGTSSLQPNLKMRRVVESHEAICYRSSKLDGKVHPKAYEHNAIISRIRSLLSSGLRLA